MSGLLTVERAATALRVDMAVGAGPFEESGEDLALHPVAVSPPTLGTLRI